MPQLYDQHCGQGITQQPHEEQREHQYQSMERSFVEPSFETVVIGRQLQNSVAIQSGAKAFL
jgi:hypothetical protein